MIKGRKNKRLILILSAVVLLVIIAIGSLYYFYSVKADVFNTGASSNSQATAESLPQKVPGTDFKLNFTFKDKKTNKPLTGWAFTVEDSPRACAAEISDYYTGKGCVNTNWNGDSFIPLDETDSNGTASYELALFKIRHTSTVLGIKKTKDQYFFGQKVQSEGTYEILWFNKIKVFGNSKTQFAEEGFHAFARIKTINLPFFYTYNLNTAKTKLQKFQKNYTLAIPSEKFFNGD